MQKETMTRSKF